MSVFMKELKQRYSRWHNKQYGRFGTLWAERFKSVIVENAPGSISTVAAYIDLNPIRAGLVSDPKDYRWCGYAEAVAGDREAQRGIMAFLEPTKWKEAGAEYRQALFVKSGVSGHSAKAVLDREAIKKVVDEGGHLALAEVLRLRVRYFSDGVALGSREFVDSIREEFKERFGAKRRTGARTIGKGGAIPGVFAMRDLRGDRFT
jgi:putative transposase